MTGQNEGATLYVACFNCDAEGQFRGTVDEYDVAEFYCHRCQSSFTICNWSEFFNEEEEGEERD